MGLLDFSMRHLLLLCLLILPACWRGSTDAPNGEAELAGPAVAVADTLPRAYASYAAWGQVLYASLNCNVCHSLNSTAAEGPTLMGLVGGDRPLRSGEVVVADSAYVAGSLLAPEAEVVSGYAAVMPAYGGFVGEHELNALVAFVACLSEAKPTSIRCEGVSAQPGPPVRAGGRALLLVRLLGWPRSLRWRAIPQLMGEPADIPPTRKRTDWELHCRGRIA